MPLRREEPVEGTVRLLQGIEIMQARRMWAHRQRCCRSAAGAVAPRALPR